jgi:hypothetical protein
VLAVLAVLQLRLMQLLVLVVLLVVIALFITLQPLEDLPVMVGISTRQRVREALLLVLDTLMRLRHRQQRVREDPEILQQAELALQLLWLLALFTRQAAAAVLAIVRQVLVALVALKSSMALLVQALPPQSLVELAERLAGFPL